MSMPRPLRVVLLLLLSLAAGATAFVASVHLRAEQTLRSHADRIQGFLEETLRSARERPSPFGDFQPGSAWTAYQDGLQRLSDVHRDDFGRVTGIVDEDLRRPLPFSGSAAALKEVEAAAALLREGLSRRLDLPDHDYRRAAEMGWFPWLAWTHTRLDALEALLERRRREGREEDVLDLAIVALGAMQDLDRGLPEISRGPGAQHLAERQLRRLFNGHRLPAAALRSFLARADVLERSGAPLSEAGRMEEVLHSMAVQAAYAGRPGPRPWKGMDAGWRSLGSRKVAYAGYLRRMERLYDTQLRVSQEPLDSPLEAAMDLRRAETWSLHFAPEVCSTGYRPPETFLREGVASHLRFWRALKIATALAIFEVEQGRPAAGLDELAPSILTSIPACPITNGPFEYAPGALVVENWMRMKVDNRWIVRRRPD